MRWCCIVATVLVLAVPALAKRAMRRFEVKELPGCLESQRLAFCREGCVVKIRRKDGEALSWLKPERRPDDTEPDGSPRWTARTEGKAIEAWWTPGTGARLAWTAGGRLYLADLPESGEVQGTDAGPAPEGDVAWSTDTKAATWCAGGKILVFEDGATQEYAPREGRAPAGSPVFYSGGIAVVTRDAAAPGAPGGVVERLSQADGSWEELASEPGMSLSWLRPIPGSARKDGSGGEDQVRRLAWIAAIPGGATVRIHDTDRKTTETIFDRHTPEALAVAGDGSEVAILAREPGRNPRAFLVNTFRSGTMRQYAVDLIDDGSAGELSLPAARDGACWFLRKVPGGWKVVVAKEQ